MTDSVERLYRKVVSARDIDAATSRTARLFRRGRPHMAKKLGEEAVEVVIDAIAGDHEAVVGESADLVYNLVALWAACGVKPAEIWAEMDRRERLFGIAEKVPKPRSKKVAVKTGSAKGLSRRPIAAHRLRASNPR
jgi:phosphoribosyl-ATP pyrophosphohydrolase